MKTNELKKGDCVQLMNGWFATIEDNMKGDRRMATVEGFETEMGSIYSHDIRCKISAAGTDIAMEYTASQIKCREMAEQFFA